MKKILSLPFAVSNSVTVEEVNQFIDKIRKDIDPFNLAGLCDPAKLNMYPFVEV